MIIHNLDDGKILVKHITAVDTDNEFPLMDSISEELVLFDEFFKDKMNKKEIAVQIFEVVDKNITFGDYFPPQKIWEDGQAWDLWFYDFKSKHQLSLGMFHN